MIPKMTWGDIRYAPKSDTQLVDLWFVSPLSDPEGYRQADCWWSPREGAWMCQDNMYGDRVAGLHEDCYPTHFLIVEGPKS